MVVLASFARIHAHTHPPTLATACPPARLPLPALAFVACPGGVGTVDELAEIMCLRQTKKIKESRMPIVLMGKEYWNKVIDFQYMADMGTISQADADHLFITDDVDAAFEHITSALVAIESDRADDEDGYKHRMIGSAGGVPLTKWDRFPAVDGLEQVKFVGEADESVATPSDAGIEEQ